MAAAGDELLGLHEELDLADAAAAELDVVAFDRDLAMAAIGVDLPLHVVDVGDGGEVEILAPDEGRQFAQQLLAGGDVAGAGARLDHGGALPVAADALVVVERRRGRDRDLGRGRIGPQPQIGAEHVAVGGALLQQLHQAARDAHVERRRLDAGHERRRAGVVEHDEVDVARIVELARAHLAHGEHDVAAARLRARRRRRARACLPARHAEEVAHRRADRGVGKRGERSGDAHHRPDAADIGERDQQRCLRLHAAEKPHARRLRRASRRSLPRRRRGWRRGGRRDRIRAARPAAPDRRARGPTDTASRRQGRAISARAFGCADEQPPQLRRPAPPTSSSQSPRRFAAASGATAAARSRCAARAMRLGSDRRRACRNCKCHASDAPCAFTRLDALAAIRINRNDSKCESWIRPA